MNFTAETADKLLAQSQMRWFKLILEYLISGVSVVVYCGSRENVAASSAFKF